MLVGTSLGTFLQNCKSENSKLGTELTKLTNAFLTGIFFLENRDRANSVRHRF